MGLLYGYESTRPDCCRHMMSCSMLNKAIVYDEVFVCLPYSLKRKGGGGEYKMGAGRRYGKKKGEINACSKSVWREEREKKRVQKEDTARREGKETSA